MNFEGLKYSTTSPPTQRATETKTAKLVGGGEGSLFDIISSKLNLSSSFNIIGVAINREEYVPVITPIIRVIEKGCSTSPPKKNKTIATISVVRDVIIVLFNVVLRDWLIMFTLFPPGFSFLFSLILS